MKKRLLLFCLSFAFLVHPFAGKAQAMNIQDSLALVDLYNSTNGPGWIDHSNWLTAAPVNRWLGVTVMNSWLLYLHVYNNSSLAGSIISKLGDLAQFTIVGLKRLADKIVPSPPGSTWF